MASDRVINTSAELVVKIADVTIRHGKVTGSGAAGEGGGIFSTANDDLRLQVDSPAINAGDLGTILSLFATDDEGNPIDLDSAPRVQDDRIDMGAYEFQGVISSPYQLYLLLVIK